MKAASVEVLSSEADEQVELDRIRAAYARRKQTLPPERYARINPGYLYAMHELETAMASFLCAAGVRSFSGLRVLDAGCGRGSTLRQLLEYGADPRLLFGIDLLQDSVQEARRLGPHFNMVCGSASHLPFLDASFDFVLQFLLFTSVLSGDMKKQLASEIQRVLVPGGKVLWYDFAYNNPKNPDVRGIGRSEIRSLFPHFEMRVRRVILAPPLGRFLARLSPVLYYSLAQMRFLSTHYLCLLVKQ
jgi:SAM-dependent methyltransferase